MTLGSGTQASGGPNCHPARGASSSPPPIAAGYRGDPFPAQRPPRWPGMLGKLKSSRGKVSMATAKKKKKIHLRSCVLGGKAVICMQAGARRLFKESRKSKRRRQERRCRGIMREVRERRGPPVI